jgi:hypothetical protein
MQCAARGKNVRELRARQGDIYSFTRMHKKGRGINGRRWKLDESENGARG